MVLTREKILIVDDELPLLKVLSIKLKASGYDVITAENGQRALESIESENPDFILLDIIMPVKDGFNVLEALRAYSDVPVITYSARLENRTRALALGADEFLPKPFDMEALMTKIRYHLDRQAGRVAPCI